MSASSLYAGVALLQPIEGVHGAVLDAAAAVVGRFEYLLALVYADLPNAGHGVAGLTQRILALEVLAWFVAMGWLAFRRP